MKKNLWKWGLFTFLLAPVVTACNDDDENGYDFRKDPYITQTVENRYPGAQIEEVERTPQGYEVQMRLNNGEVDMHLDLNYQWLFTEFEDIAWTSVPDAVVGRFTQEGFTFNPREDDVDRIEYPDGAGTATQYRIELDREPTDIILYYNEDGSQSQGSGFDPSAQIPQEVRQMVADRYPGASIVEMDRTAQGYEIQLWLNNAEADMHVDMNYQWLFTEFEDIAWTSVPDAVVGRFTQEGFTFNPREDDVDRIEYPDGAGTATQYRIELDREPTDIILYYNEDGSQSQGSGFDPSAQIPQEVRQMVADRYPGASIVEMDRTAQGYEIQLWLNNAEADMHVDMNYQWLFTEFEDMAWEDLPDAVVKSFTQEDYTFNPLEDDVDRIEYPDGTETGIYYRIELDREPTDIILYYNEDGSKHS